QLASSARAAGLAWENAAGSPPTGCSLKAQVSPALPGGARRRVRRSNGAGRAVQTDRWVAGFVLGNFGKSRVILDAPSQALLQAPTGAVAQGGLSSRDVRLAVPHVADPRLLVPRLGAGAEDLVQRFDELDQRGAPAAGDVVDLPGHARG